LPFDRNFNKKLAYDALLKTLEEFPRDHPSVIARNKKKEEKIANQYFLY
jgi:hypothetical protein